MRYSARATVLALLLVLASVCARARAQGCEGTWVVGDGFAGVNGSVSAAIHWDPDGDGPQAARLVVGGVFTIAGNVRAKNIAAWDGAAWTALGDPQMDSVVALAVMSGGRLVAAGGNNTWPGPGRAVAAWDGAAWTTLATSPWGQGPAVSALTVMPNGDLIAGGRMTAMNGVATPYLAHWNGVAWSAMGGGMNNPVYALAVAPDGDLIAGGVFTVAGAVSASRVARWDGAAWSPLGAGVDGYIRAITITPDGGVIVGGGLGIAGGGPASRIARWDGAAWSAMGSGVDAEVSALATATNGDVYAGGLFYTAGGLSARNIARWNGTAWSPVAAGSAGGVISTLLSVPGGGVIAGGDFTSVDGRTASRVARWDGVAWSALGLGNGGARFSIYDLAPLPGGDIAAGGRSFENTSGPMSSVARWSDGFFSPFGPGLSRFVEHLITLPNGDLVAALDTIQPPYISRWDGVSWSDLAGGTDGRVYSMFVQPEGDLLVGGQFNHAGGVPARALARWDGSAWSAATNNDPNGPVYVSEIIRAPNGDLIVAAGFPPTTLVFPDGYVARWDGVSWTKLGKRFYASAPNDIELLSDGSIVAVGEFRPAPDGDTSYVNAYFIARWDGAAWTQLGPTLTANSGYESIHAIEQLPNGDLIIAGEFNRAGTTVINNIARWDGTSWRPLGTGLTSSNSRYYLLARSLLQIPGGIAVGGDFLYAGGHVSPSFARFFFPSSDFNHDGDFGTDQDIEAFFACLAGHCCATCGTADFNGDGDFGTDQDIESFFRVLAGGAC
jgi:hypothetical protein